MIGAIVKSERRRGFSGAVLVARHGRPIFSSGVGLADRARRIGVTPRTVFDIGSITKNLTLAAALALVEDGRLDLSDRLGELLPGVPADKQAITLRQLLEHRAGLPEYVVDAPGGDFVELSRDEALSRILGRPLRFEPGSDYGYSDAGYTIAAALIEDAAGRPFEDFLRERILERGRDGLGRLLRRPLAAVAGGDRLRRQAARPEERSGRLVARLVVAEGRRRRGRLGSGPGQLDAPAVERRGAETEARCEPSTRSSRSRTGSPAAMASCVGYGGANDYGFNSVVVEADGGRRLVVALTNGDRNRAERLAKRIAPLVIP